MQKFEYTVKDKQGETKKGVIEARNEKQAANLLREKEFWIIFIKPKR